VRVRGDGAVMMPHAGGRLYQQWLVDQYTRIVDDRIKYQVENQHIMLADNWLSVHDAVATGADLKRTGRRVILSSGFVDGPRYHKSNYMDSMAVVRV
jgi:hypothetical protein